MFSSNTKSSPNKQPSVTWDCVKIKVQSQNAPVATHEISLAGQLHDTEGKPSLSLLQDAVLELSSGNNSSGGLDLKLSLSYLDSEGDLVPLTSQDEWDSAIEEHSNSPAAHRALLVFAQVLEGKTRVVTVPSPAPSPNRPTKGSSTANDYPNINHSSHMFQRLARIEELLLAQQSTRTAQNNDTSNNLQTSGTMTPTRSGKDYTALVKNERNRLTTKLNKVKQMSNSSEGQSIANAASGSSHSRALSPARSVVSVASVNMQTNHDPTNNGNHTIDAWSSQQEKKLEHFLASMTRERQVERDQLLEGKKKEQQAWSEAHEKLQASIQQAYEKQQATLEAKLKLHEEKVTQVVNERLERMEQHRLVSQARDSVAATEVLEKATKGLIRSIQDHLQQWEQTLQKQESNEKHSSEASSVASLELAIKELSKWVQKRLLHLEQSNLQHQHQSASLPPPTSESHTAEVKQALSATFIERLDGLQEHLENIIDQRVGDLSQSIQSQSLRQMSMQQRRASIDSTVSGLSAAASNNNIDVKATKRALTAVVDDRLAVFQRHVDQALQQLAQNNNQVGTSASSAINGKDAAKIVKLIKTSQDKILGNQKQYASALRQTVIRLHDETRNHMTSSTPASQLPTFVSGTEIVGDWEAAKQVILSSHDELRKSHEDTMTEQKNYLVECIELSQQAVLNRLTNSEINNAGVEDRVAAEVERIQAQATAAILDRVDQAMARRQRWSSSPGIDAEVRTETTGAATRSVLSGSDADDSAGDDMEELVLGAMEKMEEAMVANCEHIQAQATAAILDRIDTSQKIVEDKVDHTQGVLLNKIMKGNAILVETVGSGHAAVVDTVESHQATLKGKLSAAHSILQVLQNKVEQQHVRVQQVPQVRQATTGVSRRTQQDHTSNKPHVEENELLDPLNDMDESRHGELRILYDLDRSRSSQSMRRNDLDDSRMSIHSTRGMPIPRQPSPKSPKRTRAGKLSVQRFLEMDTRAHLLEQAYECIKFNRPLPEDAQRASFASRESDEFAGGTKFGA